MASMVSSDALSISAKTRTTYDFTKFYENGRFADATVVCKGREWKVHKLVLASKSEYFLKAFDGPFKVGGCISESVLSNNNILLSRFLGI